jgi:conjugal transfer pilus assembly protein TraF
MARSPYSVALTSVASVALLSAAALADEPVRLDDAYGDAFVHYDPYVVPAKPASAPTPSSPTHAAARPTAPVSGPERVDVEWLRKNLPLLRDRAIDNPTPDNVAAELYVQRVVLDKSQRYAEMRMKVVHDDPLLDENNRVPYASAGAQAVRNANLQGEQQAVHELAQQGGLLIFVDGSCRFCAMQMPVASLLQRDYDMQYLVVSLDGALPKGYQGKVTRDNGLYHKLGLRLTPSIVFVPRPRAYSDGHDPNTYLVVAQGYYAADELIKQIAYAGHSTRLLSSPTMAALDVWDRGVASTDDLGALSLDVNQPAQIRQSLQPLLLKQYQRPDSTPVRPAATGGAQ